MHSAQPLDILFEEAGASLGRIERELRLKDEARAARFEARLAAIELAALKAEEQRDRHFNGILDLLEAKVNTCIANVKDGEPGRDGKDADISHLEREFRDHVDHSVNLISNLDDQVSARLAEVKDGKDGEPGRDGKDADIRPLIDELEEFKSQIHAQFMETSSEYIDRVETKLAEVKDGKDADIAPLREEMMWAYAALKKDAEQKIEGLLSTVRNGEDGEPGKDGEPGPPGRDGKDGKDGKLPIAREWTNRVHYEGDVVRHAGATYQALADTGREPPHRDWGELASRGTDGLGFVLRGTYDASAEYKQHDIVMINRNSFAAKYDSPGECPGDGWQLFGPSGQRGKEGPPGQKGEPGRDGRSISVTKWEADPDEMVLRVTDSSGDIFTIDLQPIAERILEAAR